MQNTVSQEDLQVAVAQAVGQLFLQNVQLQAINAKQAQALEPTADDRSDPSKNT